MFSSNQPVFEKRFLGRFVRSHVRVFWHSEKRSLPEALRAAMDAFWQDTVSTSVSGAHLFNGDLCRLERWEIDGDELELHLGYTNYKELLYSNDRMQKGENVPFEQLSYALGISAVLLSCDEQIILIQRSQTVGEFPGQLDILGGHIHPAEHAVAGTPDPFVAIEAEIEEEMGLKPTEYSLECIALLETLSTRKPELIFITDSGLPARNIVEKGREAESPEVGAILTVARDSLPSFLKTRGHEFSPSAFGGLCLYAEFLENS